MPSGFFGSLIFAIIAWIFMEINSIRIKFVTSKIKILCYKHKFPGKDIFLYTTGCPLTWRWYSSLPLNVKYPVEEFPWIQKNRLWHKISERGESKCWRIQFVITTWKAPLINCIIIPKMNAICYCFFFSCFIFFFSCLAFTLSWLAFNIR